jgi:hypothetical protein
MFSDVHFIIVADAGDSAKAENIAAVIKIVFIKNPPLERNQRAAGFRGTHPPPAMFPREANFACCNAAIHGRQAKADM